MQMHLHFPGIAQQHRGRSTFGVLLWQCPPDACIRNFASLRCANFAPPGVNGITLLCRRTRAFVRACVSNSNSVHAHAVNTCTTPHAWHPFRRIACDASVFARVRTIALARARSWNDLCCTVCAPLRTAGESTDKRRRRQRRKQPMRTDPLGYYLESMGAWLGTIRRALAHSHTHHTSAHRDCI